MKKYLIRITIMSLLLISSLPAMAMAGMAERYYAVWLAWMALWLTVLICQIVGCALAWQLRKRPPFSWWRNVISKLRYKTWLKTLTAGIFFSFVVAIVIEPVCGFWFLLAYLPLFILWVADWLIVYVAKWRRKIASEKAIYWLSVLSVSALIGCLIHPILFDSGLTWPIARFFYMGDGSGSIYETSLMYSQNVSLVKTLTIYFVLFLIPWALVSLRLLVQKKGKFK